MLSFQNASTPRFRLAGALALLGALLVSCSAQPVGPRQGTPEWLYQAAAENYALGDFAKAAEQLEEASYGMGEVGPKAELWLAALRAGLSYGYDELADAFAKGMDINEAMIEHFQPSVSEYRRRTKVFAVDFAEDLADLNELVGQEGSVTFGFPMPEGNATPSPVLTSVESGNRVDAQLPAMEDQTLTRGVFLGIAGLVGKDAADLLSATEPMEVDVGTVRFGVARTLLDMGIMFDRENINDPKIRRVLVDQAEMWGEPHYENETLADAVEDFKFDLENERRDMSGRRRMKKVD